MYLESNQGIKGGGEGEAGWGQTSRRWFWIQGEGTKRGACVPEGYGVAEVHHGFKCAIQTLLVLSPPDRTAEAAAVVLSGSFYVLVIILSPQNHFILGRRKV